MSTPETTAPVTRMNHTILAKLITAFHSGGLPEVYNLASTLCPGIPVREVERKLRHVEVLALTEAQKEAIATIVLQVQEERHPFLVAEAIIGEMKAIIERHYEALLPDWRKSERA